MWKQATALAGAGLGLITLWGRAMQPASPAAHPLRAPASSPAAVSDTLHNVLRVSDRLISGSVPNADADFAQIRALGARTILSVDGAAPNLEKARVHGLRYVHLPIGYHGIERERQLEIARAVRDLPGPVYLHCHHGKHRGPAAAAAAAILLGDMSPDDGVAFLKRAGTADSYQGLYRCVSAAAPADASALDAAPAIFPAVAPVPGFVQAMADAQEAYDHLVETRDAGWRVPADHPDLVPLHEAGRLEGIVRTLQTDPERSKHPDDFAVMLRAALERTQELESALKSGAPPSDLTSKLSRVGASCKECHARHRDNR